MMVSHIKNKSDSIFLSLYPILRVTELPDSIRQWCLRPQNLEFMENYFPGSTQSIHKHPRDMSMEIESEIKIEKEEVIPLMIKNMMKGK